ncbi:MAG: UPF0182 family protein, partial [Chloroflexota bacterium]|nr:UPF0182 family protein [Chloroflexota bacterium]
SALQAGLLALLLVTLAVTVAIYLVRLGLKPREIRAVPEKMRSHVLPLAAGAAVALAARFWLANFELAFSTSGVVYGASFTDDNVRRLANYALTALTLVVGIALIANIYSRRLRLLASVVALWLVGAVLLSLIIPLIVQQAIVVPAELRRERPYIEQNLLMTRSAYGLDNVETSDFSGQGALVSSDLATEATTLANVRLWDYRVILPTFQQLQSFVPFYRFHDVDVDRYDLEDGLTQVVISARELDVNGLPENAQTWTNRHLAYTHGLGVVVSPASKVSRQGLPTFLVGQVPPDGQGPLAISRPELYFGEAPSEWVILNTEQAEFGGIAGSGEPLPTQPYSGDARGSIGMDSFFTRTMLAAHLGDRNVLLSGLLTGESRLLLRRGVVERARAVAPFLTYDPDPYIVIADGRLIWILDAYTSTDRFPHATPRGELNYLRNSIKVIVDAYDGTTTFYRTEQDDPIADAYDAIYSGLFHPISDVSPSIAAHFRYPEHLFNVQTEIYAAYHVNDSRAFYDGDDRWAIAEEEVDDVVQRMEPYFVTMSLPDEPDADFTLILPFTPGGSQDRQNMTAWMAARVESDGTPRLVSYRFPRQVTVFGPRQIEARINQEPDISAQISLWNRSGSSVIRGNLLVIPLDDTVVYIQPLYLEATGTTASLPELQRVIVATDERVVMRATFEEALAAAIAPSNEVARTPPLPINAVPPDAGTSGAQPNDPIVLAERALAAYDASQVALANGDWEIYGRRQDELAAILRELEGAVASPVATPPESR